MNFKVSASKKTKLKIIAGKRYDRQGVPDGLHRLLPGRVNTHLSIEFLNTQNQQHLSIGE